MPASQSKEVPKEELSRDDKEGQELVSIFGKSTLLAVLAGSMLFTARQAVAKDSGLFPDAAGQALFLTRLASAGALAEFLVNPIFGKLVDTHGRRPYLVGSGFPIIVVHMLSFLYAKSKFPMVLDSMLSIPLTTVYFSTYRAALADKLSAKEMAKANATIGIFAGLGVVGGPLLAQLVMRKGAKYCYFVAAVMQAIVAVMMARVKETLRPEDRKPLILGDMQPLSFMQLMKDKVVSRLMFTTGLQSFTEGRSINEIYVIYMLNELKWNWSQINFLVSMSGIALVFSGIVAKPMLDAMGMRKFTTFNNTCNGLSLMAYGALPPFGLLLTWVHMIMGVIFAAPAGRKRDAVEALIMTLGQERGFGNGFVSSAMNNFRSIPNVLGPLLLGSAYAWGAKRNKPWVPFLVGVLSIVLAELSFRSLSAKSLGLDAKGQPIQDEAKTKEAKGEAKAE